MLVNRRVGRQAYLGERRTARALGTASDLKFNEKFNRRQSYSARALLTEPQGQKFRLIVADSDGYNSKLCGAKRADYVSHGAGWQPSGLL